MRQRPETVEAMRLLFGAGPEGIVEGLGAVVEGLSGVERLWPVVQALGVGVVERSEIAEVVEAHEAFVIALIEVMGLSWSTMESERALLLAERESGAALEVAQSVVEGWGESVPFVRHLRSALRHIEGVTGSWEESPWSREEWEMLERALTLGREAVR